MKEDRKTYCFAEKILNDIFIDIYSLLNDLGWLFVRPKTEKGSDKEATTIRGSLMNITSVTVFKKQISGVEDTQEWFQVVKSQRYFWACISRTVIFTRHRWYLEHRVDSMGTLKIFGSHVKPPKSGGRAVRKLLVVTERETPVVSILMGNRCSANLIRRERVIGCRWGGEGSIEQELSEREWAVSISIAEWRQRCRQSKYWHRQTRP